MDLVIYFLGEGVLWGVILVGFFLYFLVTHSTVGAADNVETRRAIYMLREERWRRTYAELIAAWLDRLDGLWTKELQADPPPFAAHSPRAAFSHGLLNFTLAFALAYPVFGLLLHWLATGATQSVGGVEVIPPAEAWWERPAVIAGLSILFLGFIRASIDEARATLNSNSRPRILLVFFLICVTGVSFIIFDVFIGYFDWKIRAILYVFTIFLIGSVSIANRYSGIIAVFLAFSFSSTHEAIKIYYLFLLGAAATIVVWLGAQLHKPTLLLSLWVLFGTAATLLAIDSAQSIGQEAISLIVFLGLLPLLNGVTDFLSIGMTRLLLRRAENTAARWARPALWLFDLAFALFTLALLSGAFIAIIVLVRPASGEPLIDVLALIADVRARPANYWWLGFMVFTTLLPSFIHMVAAAYSVAIFYLPEWREGLAARLEDGMRGDGQRGAEGRLRLVALLTFAWGAPTAALVTAASLVWSERVGLRTWSLDQAEGFARWVAGFA
ncbi:MAG: hypothetical protein ACE37J_20460 [Pikeienuella sp.]|uniref:hypothetical protein n=1 Tax=Pikeienuella sp. TaxID=2831957 RepID=UPI00391CA938